MDLLEYIFNYSVDTLFKQSAIYRKDFINFLLMFSLNCWTETNPSSEEFYAIKPYVQKAWIGHNMLLKQLEELGNENCPPFIIEIPIVLKTFVKYYEVLSEDE